MISLSTKIKIYLVIILASDLVGQDYSLDDCIQTSLGQKKTILSATLDVVSAEKAVKASYSGILPRYKHKRGSRKIVFLKEKLSHMIWEVLILIFWIHKFLQILQFQVALIIYQQVYH